MQLDFTEEQEELRESVRAVLARECRPAVVRELVEKRVAAAPATADALWARMVDLGWPALTVPEADGGLGLGAVELAVVAEELGRAMAPGPLLPTVSQFVPAIREAAATPEQRARFLQPVAEGGGTGSLAHAGPAGGFDIARSGVRAERARGGWVLAGHAHFVVEGDTVDEVVVAARTPDGTLGAFVVPRVDAGCTPVSSLDPSRGLATLHFDGVVVPSERMLGEPGRRTETALRRAVEEAATMLALETVGTAQRVLDVTLDHVKHREQFGVPVGSFQAVKHKLVDLYVAVERARVTGYFAALTLAEDDPRRSVAASMAKAAAGDAQRVAAKEGIQLHGGIGYTWEHDMHLYVRRLKAGDALLGTAAEHRARIADLIGV